MQLISFFTLEKALQKNFAKFTEKQLWWRKLAGQLRPKACRTPFNSCFNMHHLRSIQISRVSTIICSDFFSLLFGCPTVNSGPLSRGHHLSPNVNHRVLSISDSKVTGSSAGCEPVNLLHIFRTTFPKNTSEWLLLLFTELFSELKKIVELVETKKDHIKNSNVTQSIIDLIIHSNEDCLKIFCES